MHAVLVTAEVEVVTGAVQGMEMTEADAVTEAEEMRSARSSKQP